MQSVIFSVSRVTVYVKVKKFEQQEYLYSIPLLLTIYELRSQYKTSLSSMY
jgi:hypothetical protein